MGLRSQHVQRFRKSLAACLRSGRELAQAISPGLNSAGSTIRTKGDGPGTGLVGIMGRAEHPSPAWRTRGSPASHWLSLILPEVIDREDVMNTQVATGK